MTINWKIEHFIEYCIRSENRLKYNELRQRYKIEDLNVRGKYGFLRIMYDLSKELDNLQVISHDINLR